MCHGLVLSCVNHCRRSHSCSLCAALILQVVRSFAKGPVEALQIAATEFGRLANQITTGAASRACQYMMQSPACTASITDEEVKLGHQRGTI